MKENPNSVAASWPKLSESLGGPRHPRMCQSCDMPMFDVPDRDDETLTYWLECDGLDRPTNVVVVLCKQCADRLIERHPRLYSQLQPNEVFPGAMPLCVDCRVREGLRCAKARINGGPGVRVTQRRGPMAIVCGTRNGRRFSARVAHYLPATACDGREVDG